MNQSLDTLEVSVYQLAQKFETLVGENRRLNEEIDRLKLEHEQQKREHEAAVDELSEALLVQVGKLKEDLQGKIDNLNAEKNNTAAHWNRLQKKSASSFPACRKKRNHKDTP